MFLGTSAAGLRRYSMSCPKKVCRQVSFILSQLTTGSCGCNVCWVTRTLLDSATGKSKNRSVRVWPFGKYLLKNGCCSVKVPGTERLAENFPSLFCLCLRIDSL